MSVGESIAPFLGRIVLSWFFIVQAARYIRDWNETAVLLTMKAVPAPPLSMLFALIAAVLGSISLFLGYRTRIGALALFTVTLISTVTLHDYWHIRASVARDADFDIFARNVAIAGGLLMLIGLGSGRFAMDNAKPKGAGPPRPATAGGKR
jgi:putative oxidoreductase